MKKLRKKKKLRSCKEQMRVVPSKEVFYTVLNQITDEVDTEIWDNICHRTRFIVEIIDHIEGDIHET